MIDYDTLFCFVDDFCKAFQEWWNKQLLQMGRIKRKRLTKLHLSEIVTILIAYPQSGYRCFKDYYQKQLLMYHRGEFPNLVSYDRFVSLIKRAFPVILMLFGALRGKPTAIQFIDSTPYRVCHPSRRFQHKVFQGMAALSKNSMGWFFGLKLHLIFNTKGEIVRLVITPANQDDRQGLQHMAKDLIGKMFGDRGYISQKLFQKLWQQGLQLVTRLKKNMQNKLMNIWDHFYLNKRGVVETIISSIKSCGTFEHSRHRNVTNAFCHIFSALIAYQIRPFKPNFLPNMLNIPQN